MSRANDWAMDLKSARYRQPEGLTIKIKDTALQAVWFKADIAEDGLAIIRSTEDEGQLRLTPDIALALGRWLILNFEDTK